MYTQRGKGGMCIPSARRASFRARDGVVVPFIELAILELANNRFDSNIDIIY